MIEGDGNSGRRFSFAGQSQSAAVPIAQVSAVELYFIRFAMPDGLSSKWYPREPAAAHDWPPPLWLRLVGRFAFVAQMS